MKYKVHWKSYRLLPWFSKTVVGHQLEGTSMTLHLEGGSIIVVPEWSKKYAKLGPDWALALKEQMSKEAGQEVK